MGWQEMLSKGDPEWRKKLPMVQTESHGYCMIDTDAEEMGDELEEKQGNIQNLEREIARLKELLEQLIAKDKFHDNTLRDLGDEIKCLKAELAVKDKALERAADILFYGDCVKNKETCDITTVVDCKKCICTYPEKGE